MTGQLSCGTRPRTAAMPMASDTFQQPSSRIQVHTGAECFACSCLAAFCVCRVRKSLTARMQFDKLYPTSIYLIATMLFKLNRWCR